jgi:hypothetical protein
MSALLLAAVLAHWTGRMEPMPSTIAHKPWIRCQYLMPDGAVEWRAFQASACPKAIEVKQ